MDATHDLWTTTVTSALLGTERQAFTPPPAPGALGDLLASLTARPSESVLLATAATVSTHRRAGRKPAAIATPPQPTAPPDTLPVCSPQAAGRLAALLTTGDAELLDEWLTLCAAAKQRVPHRLILPLIETMAQRPTVAERAAAVLGERGQWLIAQNPVWQAVASPAQGSEDDDSAWQTGTKDRRIALLRRLRATDPAKARQLVESTWPQDGADERALFLKEFTRNLTSADEPLLETALAQRAKDVRKIAGELLATIPNSAMSKRILARAEPLLDYAKPAKKGGVGELRVAPPKEVDDGWSRDGIDTKPPYATGERAWWLQQALSLVPPSTWAARFNATPDDLIRAATASKWDKSLIAGWTSAALRFADATWANAILTHALPDLNSAIALLELLPSEQRDAVALRWLRDSPIQGGSNQEHLGMRLLTHAPITWGEAVAREAVRQLRNLVYQIQIRGYHEWMTHDPWKRLARRIPPLAEFADGWAPADNYDNAIEQFVSLVRFRHEMRQEFKQR